MEDLQRSPQPALVLPSGLGGGLESLVVPWDVRGNSQNLL